ncbi:unnamed protein product [Enterobius vermicularis]|uniref:Uncharacterized protein n=1 Tax=Enterobius vermicularis TaxID=51028 RepID=A0A0N4V037_ENTVE|nr:unnamed protein product [Enterobius vermicularis]
MERTSVTLSRDLGMDDMECNSLPNDMLDVGALGPVELTLGGKNLSAHLVLNSFRESDCSVADRMLGCSHSENRSTVQNSLSYLNCEILGVENRDAGMRNCCGVTAAGRTLKSNEKYLKEIVAVIMQQDCALLSPVVSFPLLAFCRSLGRPLAPFFGAAPVFFFLVEAFYFSAIPSFIPSS